MKLQNSSKKSQWTSSATYLIRRKTVDDNAYTNVMARWNLERAADAVAILKRERPADWERQAARLALEDDEPAIWRRIAAALVTGFDPGTGLFEQFEGYFGLGEVDAISHWRCAMPVDLRLGPEGTRRSKVVKQADVVLLCALLWDEWPQAVHAANFKYYEPRTAHGSSLSPAIHSLVAAPLGDAERTPAALRAKAIAGSLLGHRNLHAAILPAHRAGGGARARRKQIAGDAVQHRS